MTLRHALRALAALLTLMVPLAAPAGGAAAAPVRTDAGPLRLALQDGRQHALAEFRGSVVVLGFTVPSCDTCIPTLRRLDALARAYPRRTLTAIAVNVGPGGPRPLAAYAVRIGAGRSLFAADPGLRVVHALGVRQLETVVVLDRHGRMVRRGVNLSMTQILRTIRPLLTSQSQPTSLTPS